MFSKTFEKDSNYIFLSKTISNFGSGFSKFVLPLYVYEVSKNPTHVGMQWAVVALTQLLATYLAPRINFFKDDKSGVINLDIALMLSTLIPLFTYNYAPIFGTYLSCFLTTFIVTIQNGYLESLLGHSYQNEDQIEKARNNILGKSKTGENLGLLLGFSLAGISSQLLGYKLAFIIDSLSFLVSALFLINVNTRGHLKERPIPKASFSLIFGKDLFNLSMAQVCAAFATFIMNGIWIVTLKDSLKASDYDVNKAFILQFILGLIGAKAFIEFSKKYEIKDEIPFYFRLSFILVFLLFAFSQTSNQFIIVYGVFSFIIAFSLPAIQGMFQRGVSVDKLRGVGTARIALNSIAGSVAAAGASFMLNFVSYKLIFLTASFVSCIGGVFFYKHIKNNH